MATASGTKDKYFHHFVERIQETTKEVREAMKSQPLPAGVSQTTFLRQALERLHLLRQALERLHQ